MKRNGRIAAASGMLVIAVVAGTVAAARLWPPAGAASGRAGAAPQPAALAPSAPIPSTAALATPSPSPGAALAPSTPAPTAAALATPSPGAALAPSAPAPTAAALATPSPGATPAPTAATPAATANARRLSAPILSQLPEFYNGCEVTSLAMLTAYLGLAATKLELERLLPKDESPLVRDADGAIVSWGDPAAGFVGDIRGDDFGYAVYHQPLARVLDAVYQPGSLDLTGAADFAVLEQTIAQGKPVIVWTTETLAPTDEWVAWRTSSGEEVAATFRIHAVLLTGYDERYVYVNNPLTGQKDQEADKSAFIAAWEQLGRQALTFKS
ncbi:MAG: C39 family peptidase [Paenibacillaceae bacterium]|nr:C39 family peptidase [Paenibacillaceae bacterium]